MSPFKFSSNAKVACQWLYGHVINQNGSNIFLANHKCISSLNFAMKSLFITGFNMSKVHVLPYKSSEQKLVFFKVGSF